MTCEKKLYDAFLLSLQNPKLTFWLPVFTKVSYGSRNSRKGYYTNGDTDLFPVIFAFHMERSDERKYVCVHRLARKSSPFKASEASCKRPSKQAAKGPLALASPCARCPPGLLATPTNGQLTRRLGDIIQR